MPKKRKIANLKSENDLLTVEGEQKDDTSISDSTTENCESNESTTSTEDEIECTLVTSVPSEDLDFLLSRNKFFSDPEKLVFFDKIFVVSNDIVLFYILLLNYEKILSLVDKKVKKHINSLIDDKSVVMIYTDKLCNVSLDEIVKAYKNINFSYDKYIFISKCFSPTKEEKEEFYKAFTDFNENLEVLPVNIEEVLLNKVTKKKKNFSMSGLPYQMYILEKEEICQYITLLEAELKK